MIAVAAAYGRLVKRRRSTKGELALVSMSRKAVRNPTKTTHRTRLEWELQPDFAPRLRLNIKVNAAKVIVAAPGKSK
jgi:hypothetical protein